MSDLERKVDKRGAYVVVDYGSRRRLLRRIIEPTYDGGFGGTCYDCVFASEPLRRDGTVAPWDEVANDPTEAWFRCSLSTRAERENEVEWGEYAPCTAEEWFDAILPPT